jgi:hypothetical protein
MVRRQLAKNLASTLKLLPGDAASGADYFPHRVVVADPHLSRRLSTFESPIPEPLDYDLSDDFRQIGQLKCLRLKAGSPMVPA